MDDGLGQMLFGDDGAVVTTVWNMRLASLFYAFLLFQCLSFAALLLRLPPMVALRVVALLSFFLSPSSRSFSVWFFFLLFFLRPGLCAAYLIAMPPCVHCTPLFISFQSPSTSTRSLLSVFSIPFSLRLPVSSLRFYVSYCFAVVVLFLSLYFSFSRIVGVLLFC